MKKNLWVSSILGIAVATSGLVGCATKTDINKAVADAQAKTDTKIESVEGQIEDLQQKQKATDARVEEVSKSAQEALQRAQEAGVLAKGKVVFEQTLTDDSVKFKSGSYVLSADSKASLDAFAQKVKDLDRVVYIEIQGHTDNRGGEKFNEQLGQERADAVRRYLNATAKLPLPRMSTISYGETMPVSGNKTRADRAANRRVVLVVLE